MTSPSTIVATSEEGNWSGLPWWNEETRCLESPLTGNYLNENEKSPIVAMVRKLRRSTAQL